MAKSILVKVTVNYQAHGQPGSAWSQFNVLVSDEAEQIEVVAVQIGEPDYLASLPVHRLLGELQQRIATGQWIPATSTEPPVRPR